MKVDCTTCETCEDTLSGLNSKLISIVDKRLYNIRYELNRKVDYALFSLLMFYKGVLTDICNDQDCDCYTVLPCSTITPEKVNTGFPDAHVNECICGCCPTLNVTCNTVPCGPGGGPAVEIAQQLTHENILERIKILTA